MSIIKYLTILIYSIIYNIIYCQYGENVINNMNAKLCCMISKISGIVDIFA